MPERGRPNLPTLADRLAIAGIVTTFALGGLAAALDGLFQSHNPAALAFVILWGAPFFGAMVAKSVIGRARYVYGKVVALGALLGLQAGLSTRPWVFWFPPDSNTAWVAAWTLGAAVAGTVFTRREESASIAKTWEMFIAAVLVLVFILLVLPSILRAA